MTNKQFWLLFVIAQLFLLMNEPYALRWFFTFPPLSISGIAFLCILFIFQNAFRGNCSSLPSKFNSAVVITVVSWGLYGLFFQDSSYITRIILLLITYCFLLLLYRNNIFEKFWIYNNRFILLQTFFAFVGFILLAVGLLEPIITVLPQDSVHVYRFYGILCSKVAGIGFVRPAGYFDEAGALAAWTVYGLVFNFVFLRDKIYNRFAPWFATVTLSIAYYIQMALFLALKNLKTIYRLIPVVIIVLIAIPYINQTEGSDFDIYARTIGRFEFDSEKGISGNNRQNQMDAAYTQFESSPFFGIGSQNFGTQDGIGSDNPFEILAKDGIIGYIITYIPLLLILASNRRKEILVALLVLFVGYQQRPFHFNFLQDLYLWSFLLFALKDKQDSYVNKELYSQS